VTLFYNNPDAEIIFYCFPLWFNSLTIKNVKLKLPQFWIALLHAYSNRVDAFKLIMTKEHNKTTKWCHDRDFCKRVFAISRKTSVINNLKCTSLYLECWTQLKNVPYPNERP
jgi:hypothetical protein